MAKSKVKKLTAKELEGVKELQTSINSILVNIGNAEVVKIQMVEKHASLQEDWKKTTGLLEEKYGSVNISLEDGTITPVEEPKEVLSKV
jgi:hypothetical protein